jgi:predicted MFS family arabinose efflux permease
MTDAGRRTSVLTALVTAAVGIAFADSSIVVLGLPELYARFHTSIEGVSWVVTAYNAAVAVSALALIVFVHRIRARGS